MAAKQGLSAQFSQASEDAKRAVLTRTKSPWLHSLNTTCTIKSAPPRSPEVLELLSTKSGWLYKRNEQHVWQSRWCCVVPHMFLYYFDIDADTATEGTTATTTTASSGSGSIRRPTSTAPGTKITSTTTSTSTTTTSSSSAKPTDEQQEAWNKAVKYGYGNHSKYSEPRAGGLSTLFQSTATTTTTTSSSHPTSPTTTKPPPNNDLLASATPAGIIDLECYTAVNRSSENQLLLELAADSDDNDLRHFYFCATTMQESDEWSTALLHQRHSQILDERDAYQQVCEGFAIQLQELHVALDEHKKQCEEANEECYRVRSATEETRRLGWRILRDTLERDLSSTGAGAGDEHDTTTTTATTTTKEEEEQENSVLKELRLQYSLELERTPHHELIPALHVWNAYTKSIEDACVKENREKRELNQQLQQGHDVSLTQLHQVEEGLQQKQQEWEVEKEDLHKQVKMLQASLNNSQTQLETTRQDLATQRMEMTMFQTSSKTKIQELTNHKKILKREVIELRKTLEELGSEMSLLKHTTVTSKNEVQQERRKAELMERYVSKMERQVRVQQNMMEMMSQGGGDSVRMLGEADEVMNNDDEDEDEDYPHDGFVQQQYTFESERTSPHHNGAYRREDEDDQQISRRHDELMRRAKQSVVLIETRPPAGENDDDDDEKSHMSELTEDRTQRNLDSLHATYHESPLRGKSRTPPSYIVGNVVDDTPPTTKRREHRGTISGPQSLPPPRRLSSGSRRQQHQRYASSGSSVGSTGSHQGRRLSVAQRARMEAEERGGNAIRLRSNSPVLTRGGEKSPLRQLARNRNATARRAESHRKSSSRSQQSFLSNIGRSLSDALVVPDDVEISTDGSDRQSYTDEDRSHSPDPDDSRTRDRRDEDSRPSSPGGSEANVSTTESMSLQERQHVQRAQQLRFLKEQGLIRDEKAMNGGPGPASPKRRTTSDSGSIISLTGTSTTDANR